MQVVREVAGIGRAEQVEPVQVVEMLISEATPHRDDRFDGRTHFAHGEAGATDGLETFDADDTLVSIQNQRRRMVLAEG